MKKILLLFLLLPTLLFAQAITPEQVEDTIYAKIPDNRNRVITPKHFRDAMLTLLNFSKTKTGADSTVFMTVHRAQQTVSRLVTMDTPQTVTGAKTFTSALNVTTTADVTGKLAEFKTGSLTRSVLNARGTQEWYLTSASAVESGSIQYATPGNLPGIIFYNTSGQGRSQIKLASANGGLAFGATTTNADPVGQLFLFNDGNLSLGSGTNAGFKFDVTGTARVQGNFTTTGDITVSNLRLGIGNGSTTSNTVFGYLSGNNNATTGTHNTFIGNTTGNATTASFNTFIGSQAGSANTSGAENVLIGTSAGTKLTTGSKNVAVGRSAGRYAADGVTEITTGSNSIYIGYQTKALSDNTNNEVVIGHNNTGLGSNTTVIGNSSTTFTRLYGNLGLGTSTNAGYQLDVSGTARIAGTATTQALEPATNNTYDLGSYTRQYREINAGSAVVFQGTYATSLWKDKFRTPGFVFANADITPHASAQLEVNSTTKGFLLPRMTVSQKAAITSPAIGLMIYQTNDQEGVHVYTSGGWKYLQFAP